ncbi:MULTISPECIES: hypothetical protein [Anaeromyxobacter]|uniref:hypothetical protein n=1 Tax=Anaeromyxobacter TaxID=161492 RepID=UPI001F56A0FA|nr:MULTISPECIES: hypothetical protein [unclassified Anaeromyxobacter]
MNHRFALASLLLLASPALAADPTMKPFVLASRAPGDVDGAARTARQKLQAAGFEIAGSYAPYPGALVLAVTNESLKSEAAKTPSGGYAAAQRVTITKVGEEVQVAYTNPSYMAAAYRLPGDLAPVAASLEGALGRAEEYGPSEGKSAKDLRKYHYMVGMEYFDEPSKLGHFASHDEAVKAIEAGLAERRGGASKVYRIDLPGGTQTVFGVALSDGCSGDARIMNEIDSKPLRSTGHLPYELLVTGGDVRALYARFRIAVNFPDLKMMGSHSFMNIRCAPDAIEKALKAVAGAR